MNDKEKLRKYVQKLIENAITPDLLTNPNPKNGVEETLKNAEEIKSDMIKEGSK